MTTGPAASPVVRNLRGIAPLIADLVAQVSGLRSRPDDSGHTSALEPPLPLDSLAFDDANALFKHLANEVIYEAAWLEEPAPIIDAWRAENGAIVGLHAAHTPALARTAADALTTWLQDRLDRLPEHALDGLLAEVREIGKRHPFRTPPTKSTTAVCPDCRGALLVLAPRFLADPQRIVCQGCGLELDEAEYARTEVRFAAVEARAKAKARAMSVAERLAAKYAIA